MLRDYQERAVGELRSEFARGKRAPLFCLPTGGGKTYVFCYIAQRMTQRSRRACILVHRQELLYQASRSLLAMGVEHGLIAPGFRQTRHPIQVASVQTLRNRLKKSVMDFDLIIIDEAHHAVAGTWRKIIEAYPNAKLLGVTATPCRTDGKGLGATAGGVFDALIIGPSIGELIRQGHLVQPVVFAPPNTVDLSAVHMRGGDYNNRELAQAVDKPVITGDAVAHYSRICPFKPAIAFCASVEHAKHVAEQFRAAGYTSATLDGAMGDAARRAAIAGLASGSIHVLTSCDMISEGTDIPVVECAILLRPTASTGLYLQQVGRALRPAPGKARAIILDHVGNCLVHGLPDDDREWSLEGIQKKKRKKGELPELRLKQCPQCFAFHEAAPNCPYCGHGYDAAGREIEQVAGELKELTAEDIAALRMKKKKEQSRAQTLDDLIALGIARNYKNPQWWAKNVLKARGVHS